MQLADHYLQATECMLPPLAASKMFVARQDTIPQEVDKEDEQAGAKRRITGSGGKRWTGGVLLPNVAHHVFRPPEGHSFEGVAPAGARHAQPVSRAVGD